MHRRILLSLIVSGLALSASLSGCANQPAVQTPSQPLVQNQNVHPVLGSALFKRTLLLQRIDGQVVPVAGVTPVSEGGFGIAQYAGGVAMDVAVSRPAIAPMYYYGGHDFNQYIIQVAEESVHKAATGKTLLAVYNQDIKPLLGEWDDNARLIESRASVNGADEEWIQLPGRDGEPLKLKPNFVFRFASTPKKETLNIYVLNNEIRVHRMIWGEPNLDMSKVKIDSDEAVDIAKKAFANKSSKPGYPVYPEQVEQNMEVLYDIPTDLKWHLQLNQQDRNQVRYFLNFSFERQVKGQLPTPLPAETIARDDDQNGGSAPEVAKPMPAIAPDYYQQYFYGSVEIDASTGAIKSLNRPVWYGPYPMPMPRPIDPGIGDGSGTSAGSAGGSDAPMPVDNSNPDGSTSDAQ